jgi:rhamnosyltransferase subunit B
MSAVTIPAHDAPRAAAGPRPGDRGAAIRADASPSPAGRRLRRVILCGIGSSGDVHPFVGLGRELRRRGYDVIVIAAGYYRDLVEGAGLGFVDPRPDVDFRDTIRDPAIWHALRGPGRIIDLAIRPLLEPVHRSIVEQATPGETLVVGSSLSFGARVAEETHGIPLVSVHLSPALFRSDFSGPRVPGLLVHRGPGWFRRAQWRAVDALVVDRSIGPWLNAFRAGFGLPPVRRIAAEWMHAPLAVLGMFPEWFAPQQPDWPPQTRLTGFPLYSEEGVSEPGPDVAAFLAAGPPPLVFTPGSAHRFAHGFFREAAATCARLGMRGLLATRFAEQIPADLPPGVRHVSFAPFRWLLPRAALLVHHGGIGSTSQALHAGIPQVIMPMGFDQFDNAARVERLGVGRALARRRFTAPRLVPLVAGLLGDAGVAERCRGTAQRLAPADGLVHAGDAIEEAWSRHAASPPAHS